jgi:hypothetical protein
MDCQQKVPLDDELIVEFEDKSEDSGKIGLGGKGI